MKMILFSVAIVSSLIVGCGNNTDSLADSIISEFERLMEKTAIFDLRVAKNDPSATKEEAAALDKQAEILMKKIEELNGKITPAKHAELMKKIKAINSKYGNR